MRIYEPCAFCDGTGYCKVSTPHGLTMPSAQSGMSVLCTACNGAGRGNLIAITETDNGQ